MTERGILMTPENYGKCEDGSKTQTRRIMTPQPEGEPRPLLEWSRGIAKACHDHDPNQYKLAAHSALLKGKIFPFTTQHGGLMSPKCPYGVPGDRLYVKEAVRKSSLDRIAYKRDDLVVPMSNWAWKVNVLSGRFMPRGLARLWLELTEVRVERVQEISEADAKAEGCDWERFRPDDYKHARYHIERSIPINNFSSLWESIHGPGSWELNPWVWVLSFKRVKA